MRPVLNKIYVGDVLKTLRTWPNAFIQTVITSPPYWNLRDYKIDGQLGLEKTPEIYIQKMVEVFREVKRLLREDGTLWLNLGDSYASGASGDNLKNESVQAMAGSVAMPGTVGRKDTGAKKRSPAHIGHPFLKSKDLVGIPWRMAFALQLDGWYLRSDIIWAKSNPMPESVTDRPTKAHEYLFLLAKSERYFYDADAIKEKATYGIANSPESIKSPYGQGFTRAAAKIHIPSGWNTAHVGSDLLGLYKNIPDGQGNIRKFRDKQSGHSRRHAGFNDRWDAMEKTEQCSGMRNKRSVWQVATVPFSEAHFATFPPQLIKPCVLAGSRQGDIVFDPFMGAGTTALVASMYDRNYLGCELNAEYVAIANRRIANETAQVKLLI